MKNSLLFIALTFFICKGLGQTFYMSSPEGFGSSATGGGSTAAVTVSTYADFKSYIRLATPQVILVSGTITIPAGQSISEVVTNKTIIGLPGARLVNNTQTQSGSGILNLKNGSNNVIIRNLIFEGPGAYDVDGRDNLTADGCTNLWVDHCEFQDGVDGNFDIKNNSDNITVSWCKFTYLKPSIPGGPGGSNDHRFSNLIGSSSSNAPVDGHFSVTFQNCYWAEGCKARMPRARNAELHILNCYYYPSVAGSVALGLGGGTNNLTCYVEKSNFGNVANVYQNAGSDGGTVSLKFEDCLNGASNIGTVNQPNYSYSSFPVADVATAITNADCGAGATLQVSNVGVISSSCDALGVVEMESLGVKYYPTIIDDSLTIDFSTIDYSNAVISVFSLVGKELYSNSNLQPSNGKVIIDFSDYANGIYFCRLQVNTLISDTFRVVKR